MQVEQLKFSQADAAKLVRKYQEHRAWSTPVDEEILRVARAVEKGTVIIRGAGSVDAAGLNEAGLPKLAIARADEARCELECRSSGRWRMCGSLHVARPAASRSFTGVLPGLNADRWQRAAQLPHIPPDVRPRRGIQNYTLLWEAEWQRLPPVDPILCRRIGNSDFFIVLAQWDLTPVERFVLTSRLGRQ